MKSNEINCQSLKLTCSKTNVNQPFVSLYFFENGSLRKPEKLRIRKNDIEKFIKRDGNCFLYHCKRIYNLDGDEVTSICKFTGNSAFVLVKQESNFKECDYIEVFNEMLENLNKPQCQSQVEICSKKSNSTSAISTCQKSADTILSSKIECCPKSQDTILSSNINSCQKSQDTILTSKIDSIISIQKFSESIASSSSSTLEDECPCEPNPKLKRILRKVSKPLTPIPIAKKKSNGLVSLCCPCCIKQPKIRLTHRPVTKGNSPNAKLTQTSPQDFKCSIAKLRKANEDEKKRQHEYSSSGRYRNVTSVRPLYCQDDFKTIDSNTARKCELARDKLLQRREKIEKKIARTLEKQIKKEDEICDNNDVDKNEHVLK